YDRITYYQILLSYGSYMTTSYLAMSMLLPGKEPAEEHAGDKGSPDGIVRLCVHERISGFDLLQQVVLKLTVLVFSRLQTPIQSGSGSLDPIVQFAGGRIHERFGMVHDDLHFLVHSSQTIGGL